MMYSLSGRGMCSGVVAIAALMGLPTIQSFTPSHVLITSKPAPTLFRSLIVDHKITTITPSSITGRHRPASTPINCKPTSTLLPAAINPVVASAVGHVIGGNLATPFVIDSVKTWYAKIKLPSWTPPNGVFAPVWTFLYASLGVAVARVAAASSRGWKSLPVVCWGTHYLLLNLSWAPLFFGMAKLRAGLFINYAMIASMPLLFVMYGAVDRTASLLLLPYTGWLIFATILNQAICKLNPMDGSGYSNAKFEADLAKLQKQAAKYAGV